MSSLQVEYLIQKEKYQDLIRAAEQDRLLQVVKQQQNTNHGGLHRNLAGWIGLQMVKWGSRLQQYSSVSTAQAHIYPIKSHR